MSSKKSFFGLSLGKHDEDHESTRTTRSNSLAMESDHSNHDDDHSPHDSNHSNHSNSPPGTPTGSFSTSLDKENHHGQFMQPLKRFFRPSGRKNSSSSASSSHSTRSAGAGASTSTLSLSKHTNDPFDIDGVLAQKYGHLGKVLGSGAGGSVRLLTRPSDGVTFAVKEFRPRRANEQAKEYAKKCTTEFCIGSTLQHPNIIQTLDIAHEGDHYYEVMEYCPIDFFAVVMSGRMTRCEINCCFRQITEGVAYLHSVGIAHRDLKLDNCVVTRDGIVKLIDFGSACVFKYPYEDKITKAQGVCGSDPYLAPETINYVKYDPRPVDIWSIAIIYCCMTLKRFPWKAPKQSDPSFRLYSMPDDRPHDYAQAAKVHAELIRRRKEDRLRKEREAREREIQVEKITEVLDATHIPGEEYRPQPVLPPQHRYGSSESCITPRETPTPVKNSTKSSVIKSSDHPNTTPPHHSHSVHGPYRLMRLLPHAARPILSRMLAVEPHDRATLKDMFEDDWFKNIVPCTVQDHKLIRGPGHVHTEIKEEDAHLQSYKDKQRS